MAEDRLVSVIVNNYNYARFLSDAIQSALNQTYPNTEVIVVDDGSTDESREIIRGYADRVLAVLKDNGGQGSAFNAGFAVSRGDIILFLDSDDILLPEAVAKAVEAFVRSDVVKVHWRLQLVDERRRKLRGLRPGRPLPHGDLREAAFRLGPTNHLSAPTSGNAWSRSFLERVLPVPDLFRTGADTYLLEMAPFFGIIRALPEPQSQYRLHGRNFHSLMEIDYKVRRQLRYYDACCAELRARCHDIDLQIDPAAWTRNSWWHRLDSGINDIAALPDPGGPIILVDDGAWEVGSVAGRPRLPFLERNGHFWGRPADDETAVRELERLRRSTEARFLVFAWPAFWWLDHYAGFHAYLRANFPCVLKSGSVVAFTV